MDGTGVGDGKAVGNLNAVNFANTMDHHIADFLRMLYVNRQHAPSAIESSTLSHFEARLLCSSEQMVTTQGRLRFI